MSQELTVVENRALNFEEHAMSAESLKRQVALIQNAMKTVMKDGEHYGVIPGCGKKPSLLKPGAEKLSTVFRLAPKYRITKSELGNGHREYEVTCTLTHINSGLFVGQGVGSCNTMEGKYRYRTGEVEFTGKPVPGGYWKDRNIELIGGRGHQVKKNPDTGQWEIAIAGDKVEHDNPADYYNTVLKMAKKRAHVDAVLTATAASDIFTQDVEDMQEVLGNVNTQSVKQEKQDQAFVVDLDKRNAYVELTRQAELLGIKYTPFEEIKNAAQFKKLGNELYNEVNSEPDINK